MLMSSKGRRKGGEKMAISAFLIQREGFFFAPPLPLAVGWEKRGGGK